MQVAHLHRLVAVWASGVVRRPAEHRRCAAQQQHAPQHARAQTDREAEGQCETPRQAVLTTPEESSNSRDARSATRPPAAGDLVRIRVRSGYKSDPSTSWRYHRERGREGREGGREGERQRERHREYGEEARDRERLGERG